MANERIELDDMNLEEVSGGRFNYYPENDGTFTVIVDGVPGTFHCKQEDKSTITGVIGRNAGSMTPGQIVDLLISQNLYW